ncbi:hypothetical protein AAMO2058_000700000 [Amorphochlora amoebiformis]
MCTRMKLACLEWIIFRILMLHLLHELLHLLRVEAWPTSLAPRTLGALLQIQDGDEIIRSLSPHTRVSSAVHCLRHESANTFHLLLLGIALCTGLADLRIQRLGQIREERFQEVRRPHLCVGLLLLGLFFLLFCAQVDRELALENCRYVQGFSFSGESTCVEQDEQQLVSLFSGFEIPKSKTWSTIDSGSGCTR